MSPDNNSSSSNLSDLGYHQGQPLYVTVIIVLMYTLIIIVSLGGNILVCYIILSHAAMRNVTNLFLLNLAISDIMKAVICNPFTFVANLILMTWPFGEFMCPFVTYVQTVAVFLSAFTLVAISLDRFVAIVYPLRRRTTKRTFLKVVALIWALALAVPVPTAILSRMQYEGNDTSNGLCLEVWQDERDRYIYSVVLMMLQYFIPLIIITFSNARIGYLIWLKKTPGEAERDRDRRIASSKRRIMKMIIVVVVIYAVCWLPLHGITIAGDLDPSIYNHSHMNIVWLCFHWLAMSHSCYNPFVYFGMNKRFRNSLKKLLKLCHIIKMSREELYFQAMSTDRDRSSVYESIRSSRKSFNGRYAPKVSL
ncbi:RYamide receptor-like [Babylonia areolata]|uniref:RYamide receptor-like n=1 Tax=Babylonia areolata TaxID=304850 RepID=UPI003FD29B19